MARPRKYSREKYLKIVELKEKGYSMREISRLLGIPLRSVYHILRVYQPQASSRTNTIVEDDFNYMQRIREMSADSSKPILFKELQTLSWWHHVVHDVGVNTVLLALASSEIPVEELPDKIREWRKDPGRLANYILEYLAKTIEAKRDAARLMELETLVKALGEAVRFYRDRALFYREVFTKTMSTITLMLPENLALRVIIALLYSKFGIEGLPKVSTLGEGESDLSDVLSDPVVKQALKKISERKGLH